MSKPVDWKRVVPPLALWSLLVLFFSTRTEVRGEPFVWIPITWVQALKISLAQWSAWGVLALVIIWIDRRLPVEKDAIVRRFLWHVPLSLVFTVAYTYLNYLNLILLDVPRDPSLLAGGVLAASWRVVHRNGTLILVDDDRIPLGPGETPEMKRVRFRTLGCYPLTGAIESTADTLQGIIQEMLLTTTSERQGRVIDHDQSASMEKKKQEGYF